LEHQLLPDLDQDLDPVLDQAPDQDPEQAPYQDLDQDIDQDPDLDLDQDLDRDQAQGLDLYPVLVLIIFVWNISYNKTTSTHQTIQYSE